ncbi:hypothetical protein SDC64_05230 [Acinetobacter haemolyticus]|uniref:hypothetical protein n=1 Tax=Acinetobacter haemolyticus TaxID=29430 RepID=UPI002A69A144|nr:hypothetical protein [Acinetobacter haemolyticus]WPO68333.1 hypothetical protein SDC64_05230 [Acinetobacter haemolyticus]
MPVPLQKEKLKNFVLNDIRVFFKESLVDKTDVNNNDTPDYVENIAIQADATIKALNYLGFINPLESKRYKNVAKFIDIHIVSMKYNGVAYEEPYFFDKDYALLIKINNNLNNFPGNYWTVVSHEIFHLYQYGYSYFKASWYLEGMANWAERLLRNDDIEVKATLNLPNSKKSLHESVYNLPYNLFWYRLAKLSPNDNNKTLPSTLMKMTYVNGDLVFKDNQIIGYHFIISFLENLQKSSNLYFIYNSFPTEYQQKDVKTYPIIIGAVKKTMLELEFKKTEEVKKFLRLKL